MDPTLLNVAVFALLGFIVGWGLEFAIDFLYWRRGSARGLRPAAPSGEAAAPPPSADGPEAEMLRRALAERDEALLQARRQVASRGDELASAELAIRDYENTIAHLKQQLDRHRVELESLRAATPADELAARDVEIATLRAQLASSEEAVAELSRQLAGRDAELEALRERLEASPEPDEFEALTNELARLRAELEETRAELEARVREAVAVEAYLRERDAEIERLAEQLSEANLELDGYRQRELERLVIEETEYIHEDDLTDIKGIGEVYADKLREAGYYTFRHLADSDVDELKTALNVPAWRTPNLASWIEQARELAEQKEQAEE